MKISSKSRYGLRCLLYMAMQNEQSPIPLHVIAENQSISKLYLEQVFSSLKRSGFVKGIKGSEGGYCLLKTPENIYVGDVIQALDGEVSMVKTMLDDASKDNPLEVCIRENLYQKLDNAVNAIINEMPLSELLKAYQDSVYQSNHMFFI